MTVMDQHQLRASRDPQRISRLKLAELTVLGLGL